MTRHGRGFGPAFLIRRSNHEKAFFLDRGRVSGGAGRYHVCASDHRTFSAVAYVGIACLGFAVGLLGGDLGWSPAEPQVVRAAFGGGSSGGGGADLDSSPSVDSVARAAIDTLDKRLNSYAKNYDNHINNLYKLISALETRVKTLETNLGNWSKNWDKHISDLTDTVNLITGTWAKNWDAHINDLTVKVNLIVDKWSKNWDLNIQNLQDAVSHINNVSFPNYDQHINDLTDNVNRILKVWAPNYDQHITQLHDVDTATDKRLKIVETTQTAQSAKVDDAVSKVDTLSPVVKSLQESVADLTGTVGSMLSSAVDTSGIIHSVDVVRDGVSELTEVSKAGWKSFSDVKILLDDVLQKILDKLIEIDNAADGFYSSIKTHLTTLSSGLLAEISDFRVDVLKGFVTTHDWLNAIYNTLANSSVQAPPLVVPPAEGGSEASGGSFWDFLGKVADLLAKLLEAIAGLTKTLADLLTGLLVPKDLSFMDKTFDGLSSQFKTKFKLVFSFADSIKSVFGSKRAIGDVSFDFQGKAIAVDLSWLRSLAAMIRPYATGAFLISSLISLYRRVTGGDVVS